MKDARPTSEPESDGVGDAERAIVDSVLPESLEQIVLSSGSVGNWREVRRAR